MLTLYKGMAHPWLCDAMGHLTTRHYVAMFDDASYHLCHQVFGYAGNTGAFIGKGWADVRQLFEYQAEVSAGTPVEIQGQLVKLGGKSITTRYRMVNLATGKTAATLESVTAFFDLTARAAIPLSAEMREAAVRFVAGS